MGPSKLAGVYAGGRGGRGLGSQPRSSDWTRVGDGRLVAQVEAHNTLGCNRYIHIYMQISLGSDWSELFGFVHSLTRQEQGLARAGPDGLLASSGPRHPKARSSQNL